MLRTRKPLDEGVPVWGSQFRRIFNEYAEATARFTRIEDSLQRLLTRREPRTSGSSTLNPFFDIRITAFFDPRFHTGPDYFGPVQWTYGFEEVFPLVGGGWELVTDGRVGSCLNKCEEGIGMLFHGNGVLYANIIDGFEIVPIPVLKKTTAEEIVIDGVTTYWINDVNLVDGLC